jgi:hypothetical protein
MYSFICYCILRGPGGERIVGVVPGGMEFESLGLSWGVGQAAHAINPTSSVLEIIVHKQ